MAESVLLDVNVCLDVLLKRNPFWSDAATIFQAVEKGRIQGTVSAISFDTIFYILSSDIGAVKAQKELRRFRNHIDVSTVNASVVDNTLNAGWGDLEDAIQYYSAEYSNCKALITRNQRDYPDDTTLPVITPVDFISEYL